MSAPSILETLARLGYLSKAAIYALVGMLAILTALNRGGRITDTSGALRVVLTQPFGRTLLIVLAIGLCGYALWRFLDAVADPDRHGTGPKALVTRVGNVVRGCIYGTLGIEAFRLAQGLRGSNGQEAEMWTARILEFPLGDVVIGAGGAIVAAYGVSEILDSIRGKRDARLDLSSFGRQTATLVETISRFGVGVRGALIATLGIFFARAAWTHDSSEAAGSRESLLWLAGMVEGRWLLMFIAVGVLAYALDQAVHARCRRIRPVV